MKRFHGVFLAILGVVLVCAAAAPAETTVELKGVHLCCNGCVKAADGILKKVDGVKGDCDRAKRTVTITASNEQAAQKAVDALAAGGFHGDSGSQTVAIKDDSGVAKGKVKSLTVTGAHNCCGQCCKQIKATVAKVNGVTGDTAKPKMNTFDVTGDFDAAELVQALNAAGFHVKVSK